MENVFQCPVCLTLPICDIYQCKRGHIVCENCYDHMPLKPLLCPTCRDPMPISPIRNLTAEQALEYINLPCKFSDKGCQVVDNRTTIRKHMDECQDGAVKCPYWYKPCTEKLQLGALVDHLRNDHNSPTYQMELSEYKGNVLTCYWSTQRGQSWPPCILCIGGETFLQCSMIRNSTMSSWLVYLGTKEEANQYDGEMVLHKDAKNVWSGMRGRVYSICEGQEELLEDQAGVLVLSKSQIVNVGKIQGVKARVNMKYRVIPK